ncbi:MAG TPA: hypothetical protein HPQ04_11015, partial [Rhodospirillaceae bacterium]|nr:hypothetical protein [Rhodospirillaceae bacterium]
MSMRKILLISAVPMFLASLAAADPSPQGGMEKHDHAAMHQRMCGEIYARQSAKMAYLEAKLELTAQQRPLFDKWRQSELDGATAERTQCQSVTVKN